MLTLRHPLRKNAFTKKFILDYFRTGMRMSTLTEEQKKRIEENRKRALAKRAQKMSPVKQPFITKSSGSSSHSSHITTSITQKESSTQFPIGNSGTSCTWISSTVKAPSSSSVKNETKFSENKHGNFQKKVLSNSGVKHLYQTDSQSYQNVEKGKVNQSHSSSEYSFNSSNRQSNAVNFSNRNGTVPQASTTAPKPNASVVAKTSTGAVTKTNTSAVTKSSPNVFYGLKFGSNVKGKCVLISRERFEVQVGYSPPLIEVFKSINTKLYDAVTKIWSFKLEDYEAFMSAVRKLGPSVVIEPLPKAILTTFSAQLRGKYNLKEIPTADLSGVHDSLVNSLLPFQREGVNFGIMKNGRVLIADDMGLGKTIQAICLACAYRKEWPLLVVSPSSVRYDWAQQIRRWIPNLDPQEIFVAMKGSDSVSESSVCILSYDLMARKSKELLSKNFEVIIMDECHLLKNYKTARCKAAMPLLQNARRVILLSGTPALSRPSELYTQINAIFPYLFKYQDFGVRYCDGKQNQWGWDFSGSSNMGELQLLLEEKIMIRRLKKDVLLQLPSKIRQMVVLDPGSIKSSKDMKKASKLMGLDKLKGMERRGALLDYFHQSGNAKLQAVIDYVIDLLESDRKFILFAHHKEVMDGVEDAVSAKIKDGYIRIDGKTTSEQRNIYCKRFQTNDVVRLAILSITACNAGLNLAAANLVVFAELFWNPGILVQAEDRAHRLGQRDMVSVHYLVAQGTADDHIWPLVQQKLEVLNKGGLSKDDFSSADTIRVRDSKQTDLMQFFEESFIEDVDSFTVDETDNNNEDNAKTSHQVEESSIHSRKKGSVSKPKQGTLFSYYHEKTKPSTATKRESKNVEITDSSTVQICDIDFDDDMDLFLDESDWDEPESKKPRL